MLYHSYFKCITIKAGVSLAENCTFCTIYALKTSRVKIESSWNIAFIFRIQQPSLFQLCSLKCMSLLVTCKLHCIISEITPVLGVQIWYLFFYSRWTVSIPDKSLHQPWTPNKCLSDLQKWVSIENFQQLVHVSRWFYFIQTQQICTSVSHVYHAPHPSEFKHKTDYTSSTNMYGLRNTEW